MSPLRPLYVTAFSALMSALCSCSPPVTPSPVPPRPVPAQASLAGTVSVTVSKPSPFEYEYVATVVLTESAGVGATIHSAEFSFDNGWGHSCTYASGAIGVTRVPPGGAADLAPLACRLPDGPALNAVVVIRLTDDSGNAVAAEFYVEKLP